MKTETKAVNVYRDLEYAANTRTQNWSGQTINAEPS